MKRRPRGQTTIIEHHHPPVYLEELRRAAGGKRKFNLAPHCIVTLPDGRHVQVDLIRRPGVLGGQMTLAACPSCGRACRVLRIAQDSPGLCCLHCLREQYGAKYLSQIRGQQNARERAKEKASEMERASSIESYSLAER